MRRLNRDVGLPTALMNHSPSKPLRASHANEPWIVIGHRWNVADRSVSSRECVPADGLDSFRFAGHDDL